MKSPASIPSLLLLFPISALGDLACRPDGPVVPRPTRLSESKSFTDAADGLASLFDQAVAGEIKAGWAVENTSFSLALVSLDQEDPGVPLWEYHHLAEASVNGTENIDRDSQYLIGSISKAITDLALLRSGLSLDDAVTEFLPELTNRSSSIPWHDISLRSLGNHLSGIPTNYGFSELAFLGDVFESLGFPALDPGDYPICGVTGINEDCTKHTLLQGLSDQHLINAVDERPAYSSISFAVIALAIEAVTGKNYATQIQDYIASPLSLSNTQPSPGDDANAVIPPFESSWGSDYGLNAPGGGLVSSLSDLSSFAHAVLSRSLLSPAETRAWLKPDSLTGSVFSLVGFPWEIYRPPGLVPEHPSYVPTVYGKSGAAVGYQAHLWLLDSHGAALILLTAGDMGALAHISDALLATFVPALDEVARVQAGEQLAHSFASPSCSSSSPNTTTGSDDASPACVEATLTLNETVQLTSLTRDGNDMLSALQVIWDSSMGAMLAPLDPTYALFPTEDVDEESELPSGRKVKREAWRFWVSVESGDPSEASDLPGQGTGAHDCLRWTLNDWIHYGGEPLDRIVVVRDAESGDLVGLDVPFLRSGLLEVKAD